MNSKFIARLIFLTILTACSPKLSFNEEMLVDRFDFEYLTAKAKIRFENIEQKLNGTINLRIKRDSAIWMSVTPGLNLEVARILIVTDSIFVIDKINKRFFAYSFEELSHTYDFDLSFGLVQSALLGNLIYPYTREDIVTRQDNVLIQQKHSSVVIDHYIGSNTRKLEEVKAFDQRTNNFFGIIYGDFKSVEEEILAHLIQARLENKEDVNKSVFLEIGYNKAQISDKELKFPFNVPGRFQD